jgi:hypothetical protein
VVALHGPKRGGILADLCHNARQRLKGRIMDRFAEMAPADGNAAEAMPWARDHLGRCDGCREEFDALLAALEGLASSVTCQAGIEE